MRRYNFWNKIFHKKELEEQRVKYEKSKKLCGFYPETRQFVEGANTLGGLLQAHKTMWIRGYRNKNLGPCEYGMFRTEGNIEDMQPSEVYLGNVWGLWTRNIPFWEEHKEVGMAGNGFGISEERKCYDLVMHQYRRILLSNLETLYREAWNYVYDYEHN